MKRQNKMVIQTNNNKNFKLKALCDCDGNILNEAYKKYGGSGYTNYREMIDSGKINFATKPEGLDGKANSTPEMRGKKHIYWFYYGDLIDAILKANGIFHKMAQDKIAFVMCNFKLKTSQLVGNKVVTREKLINIADIPISVESYSRFFVKTIIDPGLDNFTVSQFITESIRSLIMPSINAKAYGISQEDPKVIKSFVMEFPALSRDGKQKTEEFFTFGKLYSRPKIKPITLPSATVTGVPSPLSINVSFTEEIVKKTRVNLASQHLS